MTITRRNASRGALTALTAGLLAACGSDTPVEPPAPPPVATSLVIVSGNNQRRPPGETLPAPVVVRVNDQRGAAMAGVALSFTIQAGDGAINPASATTGSDGQAQTTWTLGAAEGENRVQVSATGTSLIPVVFRAIASNLILNAVSPDTLREGQTATLTGQGFDATPTNNSVMIGDAPATVTGGTTTSLTVTVPTRACLPLGNAAVTVTVSNQTSNAVNHPFQPPAFDNPPLGQLVIIKDPRDFCLQLAPSVTGADYLIGMGVSAELPLATLPFTIRGRAGALLAPVSPSVAASVAVTSIPRGRLFDDALVERRLAHLRAESRLRGWERQHLGRPAGPRVMAARAAGAGPGAAQAVPSVGDTMTIRVPNIDANPCTPVQIGTRVRAVGNFGIFVVDTLNPKAADSLTTAEIQAFRDTFDLHTYPTTTTYFGAPSDLDANSRVIVVLTIQVNKMAQGNIAGFVFSGDLFDRETQCGSSDEGELFYGHVPDGADSAGTGARSKASVLGQMSSLIAHEFTHNIQQSRRLIVLGGDLMTSWEMEGQAVLAEEVVGHKVLGNMPGQDYGATKVFDPPGANWYNPNFAQLALYYGWAADGQNPDRRNPNAPELCTVFGDGDLNDDPVIPCTPFWFYGASWMLQRYIADRFGPGWGPNGEADLTRDWIDKSPMLDGVQNIEALLGVKFDTLFAQWSAMHYVDGRVTSADPKLRTSSWNLFNIFSSAREAARLQPAARSFAQFSDARSARGGSTAYTLLTATAARPAMAVRVRDANGQPLATGLQPQFWVVRTR